MANAHIESIRVAGLLEPFDLRLADGELVVILGPSGAGKTRILRAIAGLEPVGGGTIRIGERTVEQLPPAQRAVSMVFSSLALYPHLDVEGNIDLPMRSQQRSDSERRDRIDDLATQLDLVALLDHKPTELRPAQRFRAALARALAPNPQLLLVDDGLDVLPSVERQATRNLLRTVQRSLRLTTIYATNDFADAMPLADRIALLSGGRFHQTDTPPLLYENPASTAVAMALGSPPINLLEGKLESRTLSLSGHVLAVDGLLPELADDARPVTVGIRPESFDVFGDRNNSILAILDPSSRESRGSYSIVRGQVGDSEVFVQVPGNPADFPRRAYAEPRRILLFDRDSGTRLV